MNQIIPKQLYNGQWVSFPNNCNYLYLHKLWTFHFLIHNTCIHALIYFKRCCMWYIYLFFFFWLHKNTICCQIFRKHVNTFVSLKNKATTNYLSNLVSLHCVIKAFGETLFLKILLKLNHDSVHWPIAFKRVIYGWGSQPYKAALNAGWATFGPGGLLSCRVSSDTNQTHLPAF